MALALLVFGLAALTRSDVAGVALARSDVADAALARSDVAGAATPDVEMWGHPACPHCRAAHAYLAELRARRPDLRIVEHDVTEEPESYDDLLAHVARAGLDMVGLPSFVVRGRFLMGFVSAESTGAKIEALLVPEASPSDVEHGPAHAPGSDTRRVPKRRSSPEIDLPLLGRVSPGDLGLPMFTIAVGLVDGFNPCAMWVLLFLLSLLVNIKNRARMLAIAGSFVLVSGLAYYAFMAAWLNVFTLVGFSRVVQIVLGLMALVVGVVNVKDFFAFARGISLHIPEGAKPGIYQRVRAIVRAESLLAAVAGAVVLAVLVNVIELVCTAGLPALYTQVLVQQGVSAAERYGYLALYNLAYMLDDSIMVGIAVITLGKRKLQERAGRWLKLLSGLVILTLGGLLIFAPQWLLW
ncbi:MAG TPA: hypothetical protein PKU97_16570 [Kofleriaceae bacterium]|nr:hypothetical protein [Kofleriaceae bacterium]